MPNYNLVINSTFQPFSFEEMLQPVMIAQAAHREVEDAYSELSTKAGEFEALAESEKLRNGAESNTYKRYSTYANDLKKQADELATRGLKSGTRKSLMDLKTRYSTDIKPIQEAKEKLKTLVDERKKFEIAYPTLKYERDYSDIGVDELLDNPNLTFGRTYTGSLIEEQVGKSASALLKQIRTDPKYSKILGGQYFQSKMQQGYTMEEVLLAAAEDPKAPKELSDLMNSAIINSGVKDWEGMYDSNGELTAKGKAVMEDVKSYAARGLNYAVGTTTYNTVSNKAYDYAAQAALQAARQKQPTAPVKPNLLHWDPKTGKGSAEVVNKYRNILNKLMVQNADGSYSLKPGKDGKLHNPMAIYEETLKYAKENPHKVQSTSIPTRRFDSITFTIDNTDSNAAKVIGEKYGTTVLTAEEYNLLKELGYSSNTMNAGFSTLPSSVNAKISTYRPTDFNMANYDNIGGKIYGKLNADTFKEDNIINVYEGTGIGRQAKYSDLFDKTGKPLHDITSIAYSIQNKDRLLIEAGGNRYSINVGVLPVEVQNVINDWTKLLPTANLQEQGIIQDNIAYLIRDIFNSYDKVASETSSSR